MTGRTTPLQAAEAALRESEERYRTLFDNAPVGIGVAAADGRLLAVNDTMLTLGGYTRGEPLPPVWALYADPGARDAVLAELMRDGTVRQREVRFLHRTAGAWEASLSLARITFDGQPCVLAIVEDISARKRLEEALRQSQKMEAIGQLTGGIAHDFNNFLTAIQVNAELATALLATDPAEAREALAAVKRTAGRSAALVRNLLAFSRREGLKLEPLMLGAALDETAALLRRLLPETITVTVDAPDEVRAVAVRADVSALEQILVNLATNARDAMPGGGRLAMALATATLDAETVIVGGRLPAGRWVTLTVTDNGPGMDAPVAARVFEPFFTTKPPGSGSGLGLAMVYGLMRQHRGGVALRTRPGGGTTFTLYFPPAEAPATARAAADGPAAAGRGETVLVVEDERAIRDATRRLLTRAGYTVVTAADGAEALAVLADGHAVGLVLADVVMPALGGPQLLAAARERGVTVPFIFMSGYPDRMDAAQLDPAVPLLPKPWDSQDLLALVRARLDAVR